MSRLPWSRYEGDDIEAVVSMFVCREFPEAFRVRPSRGDGGIDVCRAISPGHVEIYQVKKFASNLGTSEKAQIVDSHNRIQEYAQQRDWIIDRWHLTMPLDPTPENSEWFEQLEASGNFPCSWVGLAPIEAWVSKYPDIVDYYLRDGRDRLAEELARFVAISGIPVDDRQSTTPESFANLTPSMTYNQFGTLRDTLNQRDPHFQYDIAVSQQPMSPPPPGTGGYPALVASTSRNVGDSYVTFHVLARGAESLRERPIGFKGKLTVEAGSKEHAEFEEFRTYGRPPTVPLKVSGYEMELPGGLGGKFDTGTLILSELDGGETFERRLEVLSPAGETLAAVTLIMNPPTTNPDNTGAYNRGTDPHGFLTVETLATINDGKFDMKLRFKLGDSTGRFPDQIEQPLALVTQFRAPNRMRLSAVRGNSAVEQDLSSVVPTEGDGLQWNELVLRYVKALIEIQKYVAYELKVPDLSTEDLDHMEGVIRAARLIDGDIVNASWSGMRFTMHPDTPAPNGLQQAVFHRDLEVQVGDSTIPLGLVRVATGPVQVEVVNTDSEGRTTAKLLPDSGNNTVQMQWLGSDSVGLRSHNSEQG